MDCRIPLEHILGLSKLTRLMRLSARRFTVQERIGQQLAAALDRVLAPHGVAVHPEAVRAATALAWLPARKLQAPGVIMDPEQGA